MKNYADIALIRHSRATDQLYTYEVPEELNSKVAIGTRVIVSFGKGDNPVEAYVMGLHQNAPAWTAKPIRAVFEAGGHLTESQTVLCRWLRDATLCSWTEALLTMIPSGTVLKRTLYWEQVQEPGLLVEETAVTLLKRLKSLKGCTEALTAEELKTGLMLKQQGILKERELFSAPVQEKHQIILTSAGTEEDLEKVFKRAGGRMEMYREIMRFLNLVGPTAARDLKTAVGAESRHVRTLVDKGLISETAELDERIPLMLTKQEPEGFEELTADQQRVYEGLAEASPGSSWLLHGVTGSGKTEIYLHLTRKTLLERRQVIILVPEISLTPQIVGRFARRFGSRIAVLHSRLSAGERLDQWNRISRGDADVIIGPRSALFAPVQDPGLIILDEEHDGAYKSESAPRYHARDVADYLTKAHKGLLVLGSATPSVETYYGAKKGVLGMVELPNRVNQLPMPTVELVDMREELLAGNRRILSRALLDGIEERLRLGEQTMILLNRKGYASFLSCQSCGFVLKCPKCDISMTYFKGVRHARCSYCGYAAEVKSTCPECGGSEYFPMGAGTEKLEETLQQLYPNARIDRMDSESTMRKGTLEGIIKRAEQGQTDILVGTQMIAKGHHFPNVTLVGILSADLTLNFPDYKANERAFQLLTQVAGRTGRGSRPGTVLIQTYRPDHYAITASAAHDYEGYFRSEIGIRKAFRYPPFVEMVNLTLQGEKEETVLKGAKELYNKIGQALKNQGLIFQLLGPHPAAFARIRGDWRYQILVKFLKPDEGTVFETLRKARSEDIPGTALIIDARPVTTL